MSSGPDREVLGANAARVDSREDGNELLDVALLLPRRVLGELRGERVQEQPGARGLHSFRCQRNLSSSVHRVTPLIP